jgi:hypothetical protein
MVQTYLENIKVCFNYIVNEYWKTSILFLHLLSIAYLYGLSIQCPATPPIVAV